SGPITTLEQAMIGRAPADARLNVFGRYNAIAYFAGAVGSLAAGGPDAIRRAVPHLPPDQRWLLVVSACAVLGCFVAMRISPTVEEHGTGGGLRVPLRRSRANVVKLSSLFALDAFAGGF